MRVLVCYFFPIIIINQDFLQVLITKNAWRMGALDFAYTVHYRFSRYNILFYFIIAMEYVWIFSRT